jgi:hypothetical protein
VQGVVALSKYVRGVKLYSGLDYDRFAREGEAFLTQAWDRDWFNVQKKNASPGFVREQAAAKAFVAGNAFEHRRLGREELFSALDNHLIIQLTRVDMLYPGQAVGGQFILLYANDDDAVWVHDPGLLPHRANKLSKELIQRACGGRVRGACGGDLILIPTG